MYSKTFLFVATFLFLAITTNAQVLSASNDFNEDSHFASKLFLVIEEDAMDWSFFADAEAKQVYIDFENIPNAVQTIKVLDGEEEVFSDNVSTLPANSFYELDMEHLKKGFYTLIVETEGEEIMKEVILE